MNIVSMLVIFNDKGQILLQDRANIKVVGEDYSFFGGHLENGETPVQCLKREIKEELDMDLQDSDFEFLKVWNKSTYMTNKNYDIYFYLYKRCFSDNLFVDREGSGAIFVDIQDAKKYKFVADFVDILDFIKLRLEEGSGIGFV